MPGRHPPAGIRPGVGPSPLIAAPVTAQTPITTFAAAIIEAAAADDSLASAAMTVAVAIAETATAIDVTAIPAAASAITEAATAADATTSSLVAVAVARVEAASAADTPSFAVPAVSVTEAATAADVTASATTFTAAITEAAAATDTVALPVITITYNVYYGLAAWTNHTFAQGECCSNGGNAYACISIGGGTSTSAPTGNGLAINNGGTAVFSYMSAIDATTLQGWQDALPNGANLIHDINCFYWANAAITGTASTQYFWYHNPVSNGFKTTIAPYPGLSVRDRQNSALKFDATLPTAFTLPASGSVFGYIEITVDNVTLDGLHIQDASGASSATLALDNPNCTISNSVFDGIPSTEFIYASSTGAKFINNLFVDRQATAGTNAAVHVDGAGSVFLNNTFISINANTGGFPIVTNNAGAASTARNNAFFGYAGTNGVIQGQQTAVAADHNVTSTASLGTTGVTDNGGNLLSKLAANQFISAIADFRLMFAANCIGAGVVDTTDNPAGDDIYRAARGAKWCAGANQFVPYLPDPRWRQLAPQMTL